MLGVIIVEIFIPIFVIAWDIFLLSIILYKKFSKRNKYEEPNHSTKSVNSDKVSGFFGNKSNNNGNSDRSSGKKPDWDNVIDVDFRVVE